VWRIGPRPITDQRQVAPRPTVSKGRLMSSGENPLARRTTPSRPIFESPSQKKRQPTLNKGRDRMAGWWGSESRNSQRFWLRVSEFSIL
jgi:hypothetical protein